MQRGSDRLNVHRDDEMKHELQGLLRSGHPTRTEEWHDPEPTAEDDPEVWQNPGSPGRTPVARLESVRLELARVLGRTSFPAGPRRLADGLRDRHAPDGLVEAVERLPESERYATVHELAEAVVGATEGAGS
ncbi:DUF2795 domain-containing protein [Streptomyces poonensis]|uniref:DUF2795 domain-containing protein n=1 Tax=Streptomyces poonensis TaxID=68255 RepID=A0A918UGE9_9ACTN|nr:DUF2795 domain-containing protein [Streptomyces poonensis]GGZ05001.1 hypothetical protein GCM10010365_25060 [Streptomyces poonensis]GLJ89452.1 hypothetical protein GCM10017589_20520 [Streptomyces poonensis]